MPFHKYFHGDTGLGASRQTGWTGLVAELLLQLHTEHGPEPPG